MPQHSTLEYRHAKLEEELKKEMMRPARDDLTIRELKKRKLALKDQLRRTN